MNSSAKFKFRLYIAGDASNSVLARTNLAALCQTHLAGRYEIEIVDVFRQPKRALIDRIFITPTLVKVMPMPVCRIIGTLSQTQTVLDALGMDAMST